MSRWLADRTRLAIAGVGGGSLLLGLLTRHWVGWLLIGALLLLGLWVARRVLRQIQSERAGQLVQGLEQADARAEADLLAGSPLADRFAEALAEIREQLGGRQGVYALPWIAVLGEPGAGKSSLLHACGLDLPAQYASRRAAGATESCEFLLANQAIAIDTTGRWFRCASERDAAEWRRFLALLRQARPSCPLNGIAVALPVPVLLARSAAELEEYARELRRRLNELRVGLAVDVPVYLVLTKADALDGLIDTARHLPQGWLRQAFGWTNDRRRLADPAGAVQAELLALAARCDAFVPELLLREVDPARKRRILGFPRELEALARAIAPFAGIAFKRDVYGEQMPFLRGVYLASARVEGAAVSTALRRLGLVWADPRRAEESWNGLFLGDLVLDIVCGDEGLALPDRRLGPAGRRAVAAAAAAAGLGVLSIWGVSFAQNYRGTHALERLARDASIADPGLGALSELRGQIALERASASSPVQWLGFNRLADGAERSERLYSAAFSRQFDREARRRRELALGGEDEAQAVDAALELARDLAFLAAQGEDAEQAPDWSEYLPPAVRDPAAYAAAYLAHVRWLSSRERSELLRAGRESLADVAPRVVRLPVLEQISQRPGGRLPPLRHEDFGLVSEAGRAAQPVAGIYTPLGAERVERLFAAVEAAGTLPTAELAALRRQYAEGYEASWRRFFLETAVQPRAAVDAKASPYLALLRRVDENLWPRWSSAEEAPSWVQMIHAVRATRVDVPRAVLSRVTGDEKPVPPWTQYESALERVTPAAEDAAADAEKARLAAEDIAGGKPTPYSDALETVIRIVPRERDSAARAKLRELLEAPILDAFSAVLERARADVERSWQSKIARPFAGELPADQLGALYAPQGGALAQFLEVDAAPFFRDGRPRKLLGDRALPLREEALEWIEWAQANGRLLGAAGGGSPSRLLRLRGQPSRVVRTGEFAAGSLYVTRQDLRFVCAEGDRVFTYQDGSGEKTLAWRADCEQVSLRVLVAGQGLDEPLELERSWSGPRALSSFLREGRARGGRGSAWRVASDDGSIEAQVGYEVISGGAQAAEPLHRAPPLSLGG